MEITDVDLDKELSDIISYSQGNDIALFWGDCDIKNTIEIYWDTEQSNSWKSYLESLRLKERNVPLVITKYQYLPDEPDMEVMSIQRDEKLIEDITTAINVLRPYEQKTYRYQLTLLIGQACYTFSRAAIWEAFVDHLDDLQENLLDIDKLEEYRDEEIVNPIPYKKLDTSEMKSFVDELLEQDDFRVLAHAHQRRVFAGEYFGGKLNNANIAEIIEKAEPALEKYFIKRVRELKDEKKTRNEIAGILHISKDRVTKYY
jgi:hypothetical protein